jgi:hypothetical protein
MSQVLGFAGIALLLALFLWATFRSRPGDGPHDSGIGGSL